MAASVGRPLKPALLRLAHIDLVGVPVTRPALASMARVDLVGVAWPADMVRIATGWLHLRRAPGDVVALQAGSMAWLVRPSPAGLAHVHLAGVSVAWPTWPGLRYQLAMLPVCAW